MAASPERQLGRSVGFARSEYDAAVRRLVAEAAALPAGTRMRLGKKTSNLFRQRTKIEHRLDVSAFDGILSLDPVGRTADVLGMTTYEHLVDATLPHGLMPRVVPQLKTITLGGAVTGLGIESSSFRNGMPHESVLEMDVLTGDGQVLTVHPGDDVFDAFPNSYGSLGYALRLRIELEPVQPYVHLIHERFSDATALTERLVEVCASDDWDFIDGTSFDPGELYLTLGRWATTAPRVSDYTLQHIYYRSLQSKTEDWLTVRDYLWRWDTDWFWCSRAFGMGKPWLRHLLGRRWLRSDTYWKLLGLEQRFHVKERLDRRAGKPDQEAIVQDIEVPTIHLKQFLDFLDERTGIRPVWICPLKPQRSWPGYDLDPDQLWVNVGFWSAAPLPPGEVDGFHNRAIEIKVSELGGKKSLYSTAFYPKDEFDVLFGGEHLAQIKQQVDPEGRLPTLYDKVCRRH